MRTKAIEILELKRHMDLSYTKGDKGVVRHFVKHEEDPFSEIEIEDQIRHMKHVDSLPKTEADLTKLNPQFDFSTLSQ